MSLALTRSLSRVFVSSCTRTLSIPNPLSTSTASSFTAALDTVSSIPDLQSAQQAFDFATAQSHYQRTISILDRQRKQNPLLALAAREYYAAFLHRVGDVAGEWEQRKLVALRLGCGRTWNALAVCGMRGGEKYREGAQWAGECAREGRGKDSHAEVGLGVLGALNSGIAMGERGKVVIEGVAKMGNGIEVCDVDVGGWANVFVGLASGGVEGGQLLKAVAERREAKLNEGKQGKVTVFEVVGLLCAAGRLMMNDKDKGGDAAEEVLQKALSMSKRGGTALDTVEPLTCLADLYTRNGEPVMAEGLYRSVEDKFQSLVEKKAFTPSAADVFSRAMDGYSRLLTAMEFNGKKRDKEGKEMAKRAADVRNLFPQIFNQRPLAPLFFVDALMPQLAYVPP